MTDKPSTPPTFVTSRPQQAGFTQYEHADLLWLRDRPPRLPLSKAMRMVTLRLKSEALPLSSLVAPFGIRPLAAHEKAWSTGARYSIHGLMSDSCCLVHRRRMEQCRCHGVSYSYIVLGASNSQHPIFMASFHSLTGTLETTKARLDRRCLSPIAIYPRKIHKHHKRKPVAS